MCSSDLPWIGDSDAIVDETEEFLTGARHGVEPDRVLATVLFSDIVASTERAVALGDQQWRQLLDLHGHGMAHQLDRFRGRLVKWLGDGLLATFDGPARAIRCGQALVDESRRLGIDIRVGLHAGECEVRDDDLGGLAVHIAARVVTHAHPGEVVVSSTVKDLVAGSGTAARRWGAICGVSRGGRRGRGLRSRGRTRRFRRCGPGGRRRRWWRR